MNTSVRKTLCAVVAALMLAAVLPVPSFAGRASAVTPEAETATREEPDSVEFYLTDVDYTNVTSVEDGGTGLASSSGRYFYLSISEASYMYACRYLIDYPQDFITIYGNSGTWSGGIIYAIQTSWDGGAATSDKLSSVCSTTYNGDTGMLPVGEEGNTYINGICYLNTFTLLGVQMGGYLHRFTVRLDKTPGFGDVCEDENGYYLPIGLSIEEFEYAVDEYYTSASGPEITQADINRDGVVNSYDVSLLASCILGAYESDAGDVNGDGCVSASDVACLYNYLASDSGGIRLCSANCVEQEDGLAVNAVGGKIYVTPLEEPEPTEEPGVIVDYYINDEFYCQQWYENSDVIELLQIDVPEGYWFDGWYDAPDDWIMGGYYAVCGYLYPIEYTVSYCVNGELVNVLTYYYGDTIVPIEIEAPVGWHFSGWDYVPETMPAENLVINGYFYPNEYTITYLINGKYYTEQTYLYDQYVTPPSYTPPEGWTFSGWDVPEFMPANDLTLNASLDPLPPEHVNFHLSDPDYSGVTAVDRGGTGLPADEEAQYLYLGISEGSGMYAFGFLIDYPEEFITVVNYDVKWSGGIIKLIQASWDNGTATSDKFNAVAWVEYEGDSGNAHGEPGNLYINGGGYLLSADFGGVQMGGDFIRFTIRLDKTPMESDCMQDENGWYLPLDLTMYEFEYLAYFDSQGYPHASDKACWYYNGSYVHVSWLSETDGKLYVTPQPEIHEPEYVEFYLTDADLTGAVSVENGGTGLPADGSNYLYLGISEGSGMFASHYLIDYPEEFVSVIGESSTWSGGIIALIAAAWDDGEATSDKFQSVAITDYIGGNGGVPVGEPGNVYINGGCFATTYSYAGVQAGGCFHRFTLRLEKRPDYSDCLRDENGWYLPVGLELTEFEYMLYGADGMPVPSANACEGGYADWLHVTGGRLYVKPNPIPGDVNGDGVITLADAAALYMYILTGEPIDGDELIAYDFNGDGTVSFADVAGLYCYLLDL